MRYSNAWQMILITILWAAALIGFHKATHIEAEQMQMEFAGPRISLFVQHVGCNEQYQSVMQILRTLPWLGELQLTLGKEMAAAHAPHGAPDPQELCVVRVQADVVQVEQADFVALNTALRDAGYVPASLEFGGLPNFALQATVPDLKCQSCVRAATEALTPLPVSASYYFSTAKGVEVDPAKLTTFKWVAQRSFTPAANLVTVSVQQNHTARIGEFLRALESAGLLPLSLRIAVEKV